MTDRIEYTNDLKDYELDYWNAVKDKKYNRLAPYKKYWDIPEGIKIVADIGCGPRAGIFNYLNFDKMYAVDPLWKEYERDNLAISGKGVERIIGDGGNFSLPEKADIIFSINALDHSGNLEESINNVMSNLKDGGLFLFHIHMRRKEQLNAGHKMLITEAMLDEILSKYTLVKKEIVNICPFDLKDYKSYICTVKK